jgi:hypothetical protein
MLQLRTVRIVAFVTPVVVSNASISFLRILSPPYFALHPLSWFYAKSPNAPVLLTPMFNYLVPSSPFPNLPSSLFRALGMVASVSVFREMRFLLPLSNAFKVACANPIVFFVCPGINLLNGDFCDPADASEICSNSGCSCS